MSDIVLVAGVVVASLGGTGLGFVTGLVPGFHINNVAAAMTGSAAGTAAIFGMLAAAVGNADSGILASCFIVSALVGHLFSEIVPSTYVGIPCGDAVSVLPAHRLARAGLGAQAVSASADGCLSGVVIGTVLLFPVCVMMGPPVNCYEVIHHLMGPVSVAFSALLILSESGATVGCSRSLRRAMRKTSLAASVFLLSGLLGLIVLDSFYHSCDLPEMPWMSDPMTRRSSLLLPLFAGLFGIPTLLLSLGGRPAPEQCRSTILGDAMKPSVLGGIACALGGIVVGWLPGMTSGSSATIFSRLVSRDTGEADLGSASRFIWLYSAISSSGAVFAVGALFVIMRTRSGVMDAVDGFLSVSEGYAAQGTEAAIAIIFSMLLTSVVSYHLLRRLGMKLAPIAGLMGSRRATVACIVFVVALSMLLTGSRGLLLLATATSLGLIPPRLGVRRIHLMGCLLVPISVLFLL